MSADGFPSPSRAGLGPGYHSPQVEASVRLNTNESAGPPPARFCEQLAAAVRDLRLNRYPDRRATALREALGEHHGVSADRIFCANGSNEVLQCLLIAYGGFGRAALVFEPTYGLHAHIARLTGTTLVAGHRDRDFAVDPAGAISLLGRLGAEHGPGEPSLTFLCSPNNPTGNAERHDTVATLAAAVPGLLVVDEAYAQFSSSTALDVLRTAVAQSGRGAVVPQRPPAATPPRRERVVAVRTFSKTWALAALRLGYMVADPAVVAACERVALPYHLDAIKQAAGILALGFEPETAHRAARTVEERGRLASALGALGATVWPSEANFLLFRLPGRSAADVWQALVDRSVLVRDVSSWPWLPGCLRVTVGTGEENSAFLSAVESVLREPTSGAGAAGPGTDRRLNS